MEGERWMRFALYLQKKGVGREVIRLAEEQLSSILQTVDDQSFALSAEGTLDDDDIMKAVYLLTGRPVKSIFTQSFLESFVVTRPTKSCSAQALLKRKVLLGVNRIFRTCVDDNDTGLHSILIYSLGLKRGLIRPMRIINPLIISSVASEVSDERVRLMDSVDSGLELLGFDGAYKRKLQGSFGRKMGNEIWRGLRALLRYYVAFLILDNPVGRDLAAIGLDLCSQVYPVGVIQNKPYSWLVMTA